MKSQNSENFHYNKSLRDRACSLRKKMTKAEAALWKYALRKGQRKEFIFNRQRPVLNYIADFMCKELMLIIEVDGITHQHDKVFQKDINKQVELEQAGFTVLRFQDEDVLEHMDTVILEIYRVMDALIETQGES